MEELFNRNQQMKEQQRTLTENIKTLENRYYCISDDGPINNCQSALCWAHSVSVLGLDLHFKYIKTDLQSHTVSRNTVV